MSRYDRDYFIGDWDGVVPRAAGATSKATEGGGVPMGIPWMTEEEAAQREAELAAQATEAMARAQAEAAQAAHNAAQAQQGATAPGWTGMPRHRTPIARPRPIPRSRLISGPSLLGFHDFFDENEVRFDDILGADPSRRPPPRKTPPRGSKQTKIPVRHAPPSKKASPHKAAILRTIAAGKRAIAASKKAAESVQRHGANVKKGVHAPLVPIKATVMRGNGQVLLGAAAPRVLSPKQHAAVAKHVNAVARHMAASKRLAALGQKAQKVGTVNLDFSKQAVTAIQRAFAPKWKKAGARVGADYYLGALPDPANPGFLDDGSPDPAFMDPAYADPTAGADAAMDTGAGAVTAPDGTVLYDPAQDPAVVPMPARGGTISPEDAQTAWQHAPEDGIVYDGSFGLPENGVGSWNCFYGTTKNPEGWGVPGFLRGSVDGGRLIQWLFNAPELGNTGFRPAGQEFQTTATSGAPECKGVSSNSQQRGWGAIVGNPRDPKLANLQYAQADGTWFWQGQYAPLWATAEADSKIAAANQKTIAANRAAALVQAAQMQMDQAAMLEAQAKQDAANALAQSAADTQANIAQQALDAQQGQLDVLSQKADLDAATAQARNDAAAQAALIDQTVVWNTWAKQNPEEAVQQMQQGGGGYGGDYGGDPFEDGGNPGADGSYGDPFEGGGYQGGGYDFGNGGGGEDEGSGDLEGD